MPRIMDFNRSCLRIPDTLGARFENLIYLHLRRKYSGIYVSARAWPYFLFDE
jgi:predicted AAA+ superfamily ATPase